MDENKDLETYQNHLKLLESLIKAYIVPLFASQKKKCPQIQISILQPPRIPSQNNAYDCGVFLLMFIKYQLIKKKFDFGTES